LVLGCAGLDTEKVVEGDIGAVGFGDFVTDTEDFVVCRALSASSSQLELELGKCMWGRRICGRKHTIADGMQKRKYAPSLVQAAAKAAKMHKTNASNA
jgi:hypothetical protein